jgi:hypothetical protein
LTTGSVAVLLGITCLVLVTRTLMRVGWPQGFKAWAYLWFVTLTVPLPVSLGVNLVCQATRWRLFAGWWLIALTVTHVVGVLLAAPDFKLYRLDVQFPIFIGAPFLVFLSGGLLLLLIRRHPPDLQ